MAAVGSVHPSALPGYPDPRVVLARLQAFRAGLHACCTRRGDALVDLADALLSAQGPVASLPQLSLEPAHRRGWGSLYAALACGRVDADRLRGLLAGCLPPADPAGGCGGRGRLAALRRRVLTGARPVLPPVQALGGPADRGWLGVPVDLPAGL